MQYTFFCIYDKLMFWPSNHLINFTHAHLHVIHMDINGISKKWGRGVWILLPHACHGHGRVCKKFGIIWWVRQGKPLSNLPSGRPEWSSLYMVHVGACMRWPQLLGACEHGQCAPQARCARVRTQNTRCVTGGSVVGFCRRKNPRKCIEWRKWTILAMHACHGHPRVCIQFGLNWWDREDKPTSSTRCMWRHACDCPN